MQHGPRGRLASQPGPFRSLLDKAAKEDAPGPAHAPATALDPDHGQDSAGRKQLRVLVLDLTKAQCIKHLEYPPWSGLTNASSDGISDSANRNHDEPKMSWQHAFTRNYVARHVATMTRFWTAYLATLSYSEWQTVLT